MLRLAPSAPQIKAQELALRKPRKRHSLRKVTMPKVPPKTRVMKTMLAMMMTKKKMTTPLRRIQKSDFNL